jgi:succinate dehydrogenase / fumarate reductase iron-sulfur subunit
MNIKVFRSFEGSSRYDVYELDPHPGMTVLEALFYIQDRLDPSLSFRYSCRGAVCGNCAMLINKFPQLACRTQVIELLKGIAYPELDPYHAITGGEMWDPENEILVEPLPNLPIIKDLVVDMREFFKMYESISPVLKSDDDATEHERLMDPSEVHELEKYTNCILCATCFGACPVSSKDPDFLGPAALAKLFRFISDPRDSGGSDRLEIADDRKGWWGCKFHTNCKKVCPKGVPPNLAIGKARRMLK